MFWPQPRIATHLVFTSEFQRSANGWEKVIEESVLKSSQQPFFHSHVINKHEHYYCQQALNTLLCPTRGESGR